MTHTADSTPPPTPPTPAGGAEAGPLSRSASEHRYAAWANRMKDTQRSTALSNQDLANAAPAEDPAADRPADEGFDMGLMARESTRLGQVEIDTNRAARAARTTDPEAGGD